MHHEVMLFIVTLPFFASFALVNCLKAHWKFKEEDVQKTPSDVYVKATHSSVKENEEKSKKIERKAKKVEEKEHKKGKKLAKFFMINGKEEDLKTPVQTETLPLDSTQESDEEHESPLGSSYEFSGDEKLHGVELLPSPPPDLVQRLRVQARRARRGKKSPQDCYNYSDEEDSLFNIESLCHDPVTVKSCHSGAPLDIQDSRILRVNQDRLGYKKSHTTYARSSASPYSHRMDRLSSSSSDSGTSSEQTTIIQNL